MKTVRTRYKDLDIAIGNDDGIIDEVHKLRKLVYMDEEGFEEDMVYTPMDKESIHILINGHNKSLACVSIVEPDCLAKHWDSNQLPELYQGSAVLVTKMVVHPDFRHDGLALVLVSGMDQFVFPMNNFRWAYVILKSRHCINAPVYHKIAGCNIISHDHQGNPLKERITMMMDRESLQFQKVRDHYLLSLEM